MAGYSGTPLAQKLGIKPGASVALVHAPAGFELGVLANGAAPFDVLLAFFTEAGELAGGFGDLACQLKPNGGLWIAWPKKASGVASDLNENVVREIGLAAGLVDNKVCAVDETWSGLRFVYRLADRTP